MTTYGASVRVDQGGVTIGDGWSAADSFGEACLRYYTGSGVVVRLWAPTRAELRAMIDAVEGEYEL